jgi:type IV secretory pathway component VirB8
MSHDFKRIGGNLAYTTNWLKMVGLVLSILCHALTGTLVFMFVTRSAEMVIPIVINEATGDAMTVDYKVVDATGEERAPVEVRKFCEDFLSDAFTFNRFTARTHLETLANYSTPEALSQIRESLNLPRRSELINRNAQGLFEITSFMITESRPLKIQIYFRTRVYAVSGELLEESSRLAVMTIRPVRRSARNPHGLIVIEYRQNPFTNPNLEE